MRSLSFLSKFIAQYSSKVGLSKGTVQNLFHSEMHYKCRNGFYPSSKVERFFVPDDKVPWKEQYDEYRPPIYTSSGVLGKPWADPEIGTVGFCPEWNSDAGEVNRKCGNLKYDIDFEGYPINPVGRTGLKGRGLLGRWGSNCAGDCIITRWKREGGVILCDKETGKGMLEFLAIKRKDCGEWAIPGGFADKSEHFMDTVKREFFEEALNKSVSSINAETGEPVKDLPGQEEPEKIALRKLNEIFKNGTVIYSGYVDDIRNTDQAWISTNAVNVHDNEGVIFNTIKFEAGDDAADVKWMDVNSSIELYASHKQILQATAEKLCAYF